MIYETPFTSLVKLAGEADNKTGIYTDYITDLAIEYYELGLITEDEVQAIAYQIESV